MDDQTKPERVGGWTGHHVVASCIAVGFFAGSVAFHLGVWAARKAPAPEPENACEARIADCRTADGSPRITYGGELVCEKSYAWRLR